MARPPRRGYDLPWGEEAVTLDILGISCYNNDAAAVLRGEAHQEESVQAEQGILDWRLYRNAG